jgi:SP family general alpha glucoside:H+ symporter-like MFS transporter
MTDEMRDSMLIYDSQDRSFEEIDLLFANRTPARKFASTHVDAYARDPAARITQSVE